MVHQMKTLITVLLFASIAKAEDQIICEMNTQKNYITFGEQIGNLCERYVNLINYIKELTIQDIEQETEIRRLKIRIKRLKKVVK